ncbi:hypothetical protein F5Y06DRAFT_101005 [Hypoxylon sp. FL0890]|nr:hypothetical protein F5Y06DRAFT_101005 [Hypoxylon sp. FL0890]
MAMDSRFLELPRELRNIIYVYYVLGDGYIYDSQTRTLKTAKGSPIDLALMFTCRQVACEMKGVALRNNTITFRTVPTEEPLRSPFGYTDLLQFVYKLKRSLFRYARPCFTEDLRSKVAQVHPEFMPAFDLTDLEYNWGADGAGFLPSVIHSAMDYTLELASSHSQFSRAMARFDHNYGMYWQGMKPDHEALRNLRYEPWKIPTEDEIRWMAKACGFRHDASQRRMLTRPRRPVKCYFSAAAACIQFLGSVPASTRSEIRHIVLDEDHPAIAKQAGHARGLIPFCKENPRLRVERRANLWRSIFMYDLYDSSKEVSFADVDYLDTFDVLEHISATMTGSVSKWTMEALALIPAGMPPNSFCLVFGTYENSPFVLYGSILSWWAIKDFRVHLTNKSCWYMTCETKLIQC